MKDQINPATANIVIESVQHEEHNHSKMYTDYQLDNSDSDTDTEPLNNCSNTYEDYVTKTDHADVAESESWKFKSSKDFAAMTEEETINIILKIVNEANTLPEMNRRTRIIDTLIERMGKELPHSLVELVAGNFFIGDSGNSMDVKPDWLDMDKFRRGQRFAQDYMFAIMFADLLALFAVFTFEDGLKPLIFTAASSTPYTAFKRYLSTANRIYNWYTSDPWTPGTPAYNDIKAVRKIHAIVRNKMNETSKEIYEEKTKIKEAWCPSLDILHRDFESTCPIVTPAQCPYTLTKKFPQLKGKNVNQGEMSATQFAFVGLLIVSPESFGIHDASDEDLDAFCHVWRGLGYLLGIDDEFNYCKGGLEDTRKRSNDFLHGWVKPNLRIITQEWEHMMRCMFEGVNYYFPGTCFECSMMYLADILNLPMTEFYNSLSYKDWFKIIGHRLFFKYGSRIPALRSMMNERIKRAMENANNYDTEKHKELQERSARTLEAYSKK